MEKKNKFINDLISRMTLEQKVGAVMTLAFTGVVPKKQTFTAPAVKVLQFNDDTDLYKSVCRHQQRSK